MNKTLRKKGAFVVAAATLIVAAALCGNAPAPAAAPQATEPTYYSYKYDYYLAQEYYCFGASALQFGGPNGIAFEAETNLLEQYSMPVGGGYNIVPQYEWFRGCYRTATGEEYSNKYYTTGLNSVKRVNTDSLTSGSLAKGKEHKFAFSDYGMKAADVISFTFCFAYKVVNFRAANDVAQGTLTYLQSSSSTAYSFSLHGAKFAIVVYSDGIGFRFEGFENSSASLKFAPYTNNFVNQAAFAIFIDDGSGRGEIV